MILRIDLGLVIDRKLSDYSLVDRLFILDGKIRSSYFSFLESYEFYLTYEEIKEYLTRLK